MDWDFGNKSSSLLPPGLTREVHPWLEFGKTITVATTRLDTVAAHLGVTHLDFLHLDVQGAEIMVLDGGASLLERVHTIWLEVEAVELYQGQPCQREVEAYLLARGFIRLLDTVDSVSGDQFWVSSEWLATRKGRAWIALKALECSPTVVRVGSYIDRIRRRLRG